MASWAEHAIRELSQGHATTVKPHGTSMLPTIQSGEVSRLQPVRAIGELAPGAIVLCKVKGLIYLHKVIAIQGERVLIGNNRGHLNGWTHISNVYGVRY